MLYLVNLYSSYRAVIEMERGVSPKEACEIAMSPIIRAYPKFSGALIAVNLTGHYGQCLLFNLNDLFFCLFKKNIFYSIF